MQRQQKITTKNGVDHLLSKSTLKNDKINQVLTDDIVNHIYGSFEYYYRKTNSEEEIKQLIVKEG